MIATPAGRIRARIGLTAWWIAANAAGSEARMTIARARRARVSVAIEGRRRHDLEEVRRRAPDRHELADRRVRRPDRGARARPRAAP